MTKPLHISIVIPVYGCKTCLAELYLRLKKTLESITQDFEIIMVNDASPDGAWEMILDIATKDARIKGINFSRNFGQHYAITAGLDHAQGEWVVVMDCDLQDQPEEIVKLYNKALEGYDIVVGKRASRKDSFFTKFGSKVFYSIFNYLTEVKMNPEVSNFGIYSKQVISNFCLLHEEFRGFGLHLHWLGFTRCEIEINHAQRKSGTSAYTLQKKIQLAFNVTLSSTDKPLRILFNIGLIIALLAFVFGFYYLITFFYYHKPISGWTSLIVSLFFLSGIIIASIGLVGLYIGKIFKQVKQRPLYVVQQKINIDE
jgi:glycosyltransferase involved in cell wall biosynthesis